MVSEVTERHTDPSGDCYRGSEQVRQGGKIEAATLPELAFRAEAVLG